MKTSLTQNLMKSVGIILAFTTVAAVGNAQTTSTVDKQPIATGFSATTTKTGSVRVVDNQGTVKYLQVQNGITSITNNDPTSGAVVTTYQLGGTFTSDTKLDFAGKAFSFDNITAVPAATSAATTNSTAVTDVKTGWAILVRDVATGNVQQLLATDLVSAGKKEIVLEVSDINASTGYTYSDVALPSKIEKVQVSRNGIQLASTYYTLTANASVAVKPTGGADPNDYTLTAGDRIIIQWIR
jgi:hypothetical protein